MKIDMNSNPLMQGQLSSGQLNKNVKNKDDNGQNQSSNNIMSSYDKMVRSIEEQMEKIQADENYDADTKKQKLDELKTQIEDIRKAENEAEIKDAGLLDNDKKAQDKSKYNENIDGDKFTLSDEMEDMIKKDSELNKNEEKHSMKVKFEGSANILKSEIETDKGRGVDTQKKEEKLQSLQEKMKELDENKLDENVVSQKINDSNSDKNVNSTVKPEDDIKNAEDKSSINELENELER